MLGSQIEAYFRNHPVLRAHFRGVHGANEVKRLRLQNRTAAIINTQGTNEEGSGLHWWVLLRLENRTGKYRYFVRFAHFDSLIPFRII
jgi:hypothetical protein